MTLNEALERVLKAYERYYTVERGGAAPPFQAEAAFHRHDERYFLSRSIRLSQSDARETVFFTAVDSLDAATLTRLDRAAWSTGLSRAVPRWGQRESDVALVILTDRLEPEAARLIRAANRSRGYAFSLKGWSNYRLIAVELPTGRTAGNRLGCRMAGMLRGILGFGRDDT